MSEGYYLYIISFTVGGEAGLALVAAQDEKSAFQILKNSGSRHCDGYSLIQTRNIGMTAGCSYGLLMESFVNARLAFDAILCAMSNLKSLKSEKGDKGDKGDPGPPGAKGEKGEKGDIGWYNFYVDDELYLHLEESEYNIAGRLDFDQATGYLTIN